MSQGIYPVLQPPLGDDGFAGLGEVLLANLEHLEQVAEEKELTPLSSFADMRPVPEDFEGDPDELEEIMGEWTDWFDPEAGSSAVTAILEAIRSSQEIQNRFEDPELLLSELEDMARALSLGATRGSKFRIEIG